MGEFGEPDGLLTMVWQDQVGEVPANDEIGMHKRLLSDTRCVWGKAITRSGTSYWALRSDARDERDASRFLLHCR
jgi:hypothetical protein